MATFVGALAPIFLLILFGQGLRRVGPVADPVWAGIDR